MQSELLTKKPADLNTAQLVWLINYLNEQYRKGTPVVSDTAFDQLYLNELSSRNPEHPFLKIVQPEPLSVAVAAASKGRIAHPIPMLSTQKAYESAEIAAWLDKCAKSAVEHGIEPDALLFRVTPKFDGIACRTTQHPAFQAVTRGDGKSGSDITHLFSHGVKTIGDESRDAVGELVMSKRYFQQSGLDQHFAHPRNLVAGIASADTLNPHAAAALKDGGVHFVIYDDLQVPTYKAHELLENFDRVQSCVLESEYPLDGIVIDLCDPKLKEAMGYNSHHWHGQLAVKQMGETATATVTGIRWQVGRTGRVTPVVEIEPTSISGCTVTSITAHHAANIRQRSIGTGALVSLVRSGEVIPKLLQVHKQVAPELPRYCPCCETMLEWDNDFLHCPNVACPAQSAAQLQHFAKTVQMDLIGEKTANILVEHNVTTIEQLLQLNKEQLQSMGFGAGQSANLITEIERVKSEPLRDNLLLASLGISDLGRGTSEKILADHRIEHVLSLSAADIQSIKGFGRLTAPAIAQALQDKRATLEFLLSYGFNLQNKQPPAATLDSPIAGLKIVFTGTMQTGSRESMMQYAKALGAKVQSSVSKTTDYLICGEKVGAVKMNKARDLGVKVLSESEYNDLVA